MADEEVVVNLTYDARASAQRAVDDSNKLITSLQNIVKQTTNVSESLARVNEKISGAGRLATKLENDFQPWNRALRTTQAEYENLKKAIDNLNSRQSRTETQEEDLDRLLALIPQVTNRIKELQTSTLAAVNNQEELNTAYKNGYQSLDQYLNRINQLISKFDPATMSAKQMVGEIRQLNEAFKAGVNIAGGYGNALAKLTSGENQSGGGGVGRIIAQTRELTQAQRELAAQAREEVRIRNNQESVSRDLISGGAGSQFTKDLRLQMQATADLENEQRKLTNQIVSDSSQRVAAIERETKAALGRFQAMVGGARQAQDAQNAQSFFNQRTGVERAVNPTPINAGNSMLGQIGDREEAELEDVRRAQERLAKQTKDTADRFDYLTTKYNQDATAVKNLKINFNELNEALAKGAINSKLYDIESRKLLDNYNKSTIAGKAAAESNKVLGNNIHQVGLNSRVAQYAMTNFSFQINDVVSGLAMGQQPMRIFAQQAGQFVQIFQQIGRENIGQFFRDMGKGIVDFTSALGRWAVSGVGAAVIGATALAAALSVVLIRTISNEAQIRRFDAAVAGVGATSYTTSSSLNKLSFDLRAVGVNADDAEASIMKLTRNLTVNSRFNPNAVRDLSKIGLDVGARLGIGDVAGIDKISDAATQGAEAVAKLGLETGAFSQAEATAILRASALGDRLNQLEKSVRLLSERLAGEHEKQRSGWSKLIDGIGAGWNTVVNKLADTGMFAGIDALFSRMATNLKFITENGGLAPGSFIGQAAKAINDALPSLPTEQEVRGRASGLMRQGPSVYGPGAQGGGFNVTPGGALTGGTSQPNTLVRTIRGGILPYNTTWYEPSGMGNLSGNLVPSTAPGGWSPGFGPYNRPMDVNMAPRSGMGLEEQFRNRYGLAGTWNENKVVPFPGVPRFSQQGMGSTFPRPDSNVDLSTSMDLVQSGNLFRLPPTQLSEEEVLTGKLNDRSKERIELGKQWAITQKELTAFAETYNQALDSGVTPAEANNRAMTAGKEARAQATTELEKASTIRGMEIDGLNKATDAAKTNTSEMLKAEARSRALIEQKLTGVDAGIREKEILAEVAAQAAKGAAEQLASQQPVIVGMQKLAEAAKISGQAEHDARVEAEARTIVQRALDAGAKEHVETLLKTARAHILVKEAATNSLAVARELNKQKDTQQVLQLQVGLQSQTTEEINRQVVLLQKKQELERDTTGLTKEQKTAILEATEATQRQVIALGEAQRAWGRIEDMIRSLVDMISNSLTRSIEDAFSGKKVEDWGTRIKSMLGSLVSQITSSMFIKPLMGSLLSGVGLTGLAQQFGTFGSSLMGGGGGGGTTFTQVGTNAQGQSIFTLSNASSVASIANSVSGGGGLFGSGGMFSGVGDFFSGGLGGIFAHTPTAVDFAAGVGPVLQAPGSLFGSTTLGGALGGIGAGFGAGSVVNSLVGGDPLVGSIGSGIGSIAGMAIGSMFGMPFLGPLIGGALGGLMGLFGNNKPSNFAAGGNINLAAGGLIGNLSNEGNAQNTQQANQIIESVSGFAKKLIDATGGFLAGDLNIQAGTRDGIKIAGSIGNAGSPRGSFVSTEGIAYSSSEEAIKSTSLAMIKHIENVSKTMGTVLDHVTDLAQLDRAIAFARVYENLKDAFDNAFTSINNDLKVIGPFEQALNEIETIFEELTKTSKEFGLSLKPINAGLKEAKKRLVEDFDRGVQDAILAITDPFQFATNELKKIGEALIKDAVAIGGNRLQVERLNEIKLAKLREEQFGQSYQLLTELQRRLTQGPDSGLTIGAQLSAANDNFRASLKLVQGGNLNEIGNLASNAGSAFDLSRQAYGNAPETANLRSEILNSIDNILSDRSFAIGSDSTPSGWIKVGENGPEWMHQSGGNKILSAGQNPLGFGEVVSELRMLRNEVQILREENTRVVVGVGQDTGKRLDGVRGELRKKPLIETVRARA